MHAAVLKDELIKKRQKRSYEAYRNVWSYAARPYSLCSDAEVRMMSSETPVTRPSPSSPL